MLNALKTIHAIKPATTDMAARLGFTVFVRGSLHEQIDALQDLRQRLGAGLGGGKPRVFRRKPTWMGQDAGYLYVASAVSLSRITK